MNPSVYIALALLSGTVCFLFAREKGKNPFLWFGIGLLLSVFGIGIILLIKNKKEDSHSKEDSDS